MNFGDFGRTRRELALGVKFCGASLVGFLTDATVLHLGLWAGLEPAWARLISLTCAMQATFAINSLLVFRCLDPVRWLRQWASYMAAGAVGNLCNYWIFVTLVSTHWRVIASPLFALTVGSIAASAINYSAQRLIVFRRASRRGP